MSEQSPIFGVSEQSFDESETLPSPEVIAELQARFDAVVDSPLYDKFGNPSFAREIDPETEEVTARTMSILGQRGSGSTVYTIGTGGISLEHKSDRIGDPSFSIDDAPDKQHGFLKDMSYHLDRAQSEIEATQAKREAYARQEYGPKLGSITLKLLGIRGPYNRRMKDVEDYRTGRKKY